MFKFLRHVYEQAPSAFRWPVSWLPYSILAGSGYRATVRRCRELEFVPRREVLRHQEQLLEQLLRFAVEQVPFCQPYRDIVARSDPFEALARLPFLTKGDIQRRFDDLTPRSIGQIPHHTGVTGGSSGNQLAFLEDDSTYAREMGFMHSQWRRIGYRPNCRKATFRGTWLRNVTNRRFWQYNAIHNELQFSPFHMNEQTLALYIEQLIRFKPEFIHGYPSAVDTLAEYVLRYDLTQRIPLIRAALLGSEACSQTQRVRIEAAFRTRVYTWYGHSERTVLGGECECSHIYHMFPSYGILELIKENGDPCDVGEQGEIVGTGFLNRSMPLIRYRTDDYAIRESHECECGRSWDRFSHVVGRRSFEGFILSKHGSRISEAALNVHDDCFAHVVRYQYYQRIPGQLVIRVIPNPVYSSVDEARIVASHAKKLWGEMDIVVQCVDSIPLTALGKQKRIICEVECQSDNGTANSATQVR